MNEKNNVHDLYYALPDEIREKYSFSDFSLNKDIQAEILKEYESYIQTQEEKTGEEKIEKKYVPPDAVKMLIYPHDCKAYVDIMSDADAGTLFKGLLNFFVDGVVLESKNPIVQATFNIAMEKIVADKQKYKEKCIVNSRNAYKRYQKES